MYQEIIQESVRVSNVGRTRRKEQEKSNIITELKQFCKEEWAKISPSQCAGLINSYRKQLTKVFGAQVGGKTLTESRLSHAFADKDI